MHGHQHPYTQPQSINQLTNQSASFLQRRGSQAYERVSSSCSFQFTLRNLLHALSSPQSENTKKVCGIIKRRISKNNGVSSNKMANNLGNCLCIHPVYHKKADGTLRLPSFQGATTKAAKAYRLKKCKDLLQISQVCHDEGMWGPMRFSRFRNYQNNRQLTSLMQ